MEKITAKFRKALFAIATVKQIDLRDLFNNPPNRYDVYKQLTDCGFVWDKTRTEWLHKSMYGNTKMQTVVFSKFEIRITAEVDDAQAVAEIVTAALLSAGIGINSVSSARINNNGKNARVYMQGEI